MEIKDLKNVDVEKLMSDFREENDESEWKEEGYFPILDRMKINNVHMEYPKDSVEPEYELSLLVIDGELDGKPLKITSIYDENIDILNDDNVYKNKIECEDEKTKETLQEFMDNSGDLVTNFIYYLFNMD